MSRLGIAHGTQSVAIKMDEADTSYEHGSRKLFYFIELLPFNY